MKYLYHVATVHYDNELDTTLHLSHFVTRTRKLDSRQELEELRNTFEEHYRRDPDTAPGSTHVVTFQLVKRIFEWHDILAPLAGTGLATFFARFVLHII